MAPLATVEQAAEDYSQGRFVIIVDDEDRENEGDLAVAAEKVTPQHIAFMAHQGGGLICVALPEGHLDELAIEPMVAVNTSRFGTAFSVSVEARNLVSTGISARDRAATIQRLVAREAEPSDFAKPGHTFPLRARSGGVLRRAGQTEASVDLAQIAGLYPGGVICEVMLADGEMARMPDLEEFAAQHDIKILAIKDLIAYRRRHDRRRHGSRRDRPRQAGSGQGSLAVPDGRRVWKPALRLRTAAEVGHEGDHRRRVRRGPVSERS